MIPKNMNQSMVVVQKVFRHVTIDSLVDITEIRRDSYGF